MNWKNSVTKKIDKKFNEELYSSHNWFEVNDHFKIFFFAQVDELLGELEKETERIDKKWVGKIKPFKRKKKCYCSWSKDGRRFGVCLACAREFIWNHNKGKKFIIKKLNTKLAKLRKGLG